MCKSLETILQQTLFLRAFFEKILGFQDFQISFQFILQMNVYVAAKKCFVMPSKCEVANAAVTYTQIC